MIWQDFNYELIKLCKMDDKCLQKRKITEFIDLTECAFWVFHCVNTPYNGYIKIICNYRLLFGHTHWPMKWLTCSDEICMQRRPLNTRLRIEPDFCPSASSFDITLAWVIWNVPCKWENYTTTMNWHLSKAEEKYLQWLNWFTLCLIFASSVVSVVCLFLIRALFLQPKVKRDGRKQCG